MLVQTEQSWKNNGREEEEEERVSKMGHLAKIGFGLRMKSYVALCSY